MSIEKLTTTKKFYPAHNSIQIEFLMNDLGTSPDKYWFTSQLFDNANVELTKSPMPFFPAGVDQSFIRELSFIARNLVQTAVPTLSAQSERDETIIKDAILKFGQVTFTGADCNTVANMDQGTDIMYFLNSKVKQVDLDYLNGTQPVLLQTRFEKYKLRKGQHDLFWVLGAGKVQVVHYDSSGAELSNTTLVFTETEQVRIVDTSPVLYSLTDDQVHHITTRIINSTLDEDTLLSEHTAYFITDCDEEYTGILYLDNKGGRTPLPLSILKKTDVPRKGDEVTKMWNMQSERITSGGLSMINILAKNREQFVVQIHNTVEGKEILKNFIASPEFHIQTGTGSSAVIQSCILENGTYTIGEKNKPIELTFNIILTEEIPNQGQ